MQNELISIIVPVYQVERYLPASLDSILSQTLTHWELILVDDGSKDASGAICDEYAAKDARIRVFHQENQGVSAARNHGMDQARGAYIAFVDSDDLLLPDYLEVLYRDAVEQGADVVCSNCQLDRDGRRQIYPSVLAKRRFRDAETAFWDYLGRKEMYGHGMFGKLVKTDLAKRHPFQSLRYGEDKLFNMQVFAENPVVYLDDYAGYIYIHREDSATVKNRHQYVPHRLDMANMSCQLLALTAGCGEKTRAMAAVCFAHHVHTAAACTVFDGMKTYRQHRPLILSYIRQMKPVWKLLDRKSQLRLWLYVCLPVGYRLCMKVLKLTGRSEE